MVPSEPEPIGGRRAYDREIDPVVETFIERRLTDERRAMRNEFTTAILALTNKVNELAATVTTAALQSTREHAEVHGALNELRTEVAAVRETAHPLVARVVELERHDDMDGAREETRDELLKRFDAGRRWLIGTAIALGALIVSATGVLVAVLA